MKYTIIGDVHGKYDRYKKIIKKYSNSIALGDMGLGFIDPKTNTYMANPPFSEMVNNNARFIRGNHDNPIVCKKHKQWIKDGWVENTENNKIMFVGGALSIDRDLRIIDYSWWEDEELSYSELREMIDSYEKVKPSIMITHDCPVDIAKLLFCLDERKEKFNSRTGKALQTMFDIHQPKIWLFGHWHISKNQIIDNTRFICLSELEVIEMEL